MKTARCSFWMLMLFLCLTACGEDEYYYPSVRSEMVTVLSDEAGRLQTLIPDKGAVLSVVQDRTGSMITPLSAARVLSKYEVLSEGACIYSLQSVMTPEPKAETDEAFQEGIKTDPVTMGRIWKGRNFLNMELQLKAGIGVPHVFGMVEDVSEWEEKGIVTLLLYHDAGGDKQLYNRSVYLSVPLLKYVPADKTDRPLIVKFKYYTYGEAGDVVLSERYAEPGFTFVPVRNEKISKINVYE